MKAIDHRLTALEERWKSRPCKKPGHDGLPFMIVFTGPNGNEREVEEKIKEIRACEHCGEHPQFFKVTLGLRPAPAVTGWEGLESLH